MQTNKEALLALLKGEKADFIPEVYSTMKDVVFPGDRYIELGDKFDPYGTGPDAWGVLWTNQGPDPVIDGNMVAKDFKLFDDMDEWKEKSNSRHWISCQSSRSSRQCAAVCT